MQDTFYCIDCAQTFPVQKEGGTGYAKLKDGKRICYACCGKRDEAEMIATGKATLYLTTRRGKVGPFYGHVSNWPGTLKTPCMIRKGRHNIAGSRYDVWFTGPDSKQWHGVQYGENTQICRCKRLK